MLKDPESEIYRGIPDAGVGQTLTRSSAFFLQIRLLALEEEPGEVSPQVDLDKMGLPEAGIGQNKDGFYQKSSLLVSYFLGIA